ncbi:MAG: thermonuclease family protein [Bosea sp. (in: a-proteobacteria)]
MHWRNSQASRRSASGLRVALGTAAVLVAAALIMQRCGFNLASHEGRAIAVDGDSLRLNNVELRLKGIDAPEYRQTCRDDKGQDYPCGRFARRALAALVQEHDVACAETGKDRYGRGLAICRNLSNDKDIAAEMVRQGMAVAFGDFDALEAEARAARKGLWAGSFERPSEWRRRNPRDDARP